MFWGCRQSCLLLVPFGFLCLPIVSANAQRGLHALQRSISKGDQSAKPRSVRSELCQSCKKWLCDDVRWIISDEERYAFKHLSNDEERDNFIEAFWQRRNPNHGREENEFKEEHYRRIVFANEQFASFVAGWKTDRGRIYIMFGAPDEIESHASGGTNIWSVMWQTVSNRPFQVWHYRYLEGFGEDVSLTFVDICNCGDFILTDDHPQQVAVTVAGGP